MRLRLYHLGVLLCVGVLSSCFSTSEPQADVQDDLARGKINNALQRLEESTEVDPVLRLLEKAQLEHYDGRWQQSNSTFEEAEKLALDLYEESLRPDGPSMITNDVDLPYRVKGFEMSMIPYYRAFNFLALGDGEEARVEAQRAVSLLEFATNTMFTKAAGDPGPAVDVLQKNAFLHYLSGLLHESEGALDEAFVEFRRAAVAAHETWSALRVPIPVWLGDDLIRVGEDLGYLTELQELEREYPGLFSFEGPPGGPAEDTGTLALFVEVGWVASLDKRAITVPILQGDDFSDIGLLAEKTAIRFKPGWTSATHVLARLTVTMPTLVQHWAGAPTRVNLEIDGLGRTLDVGSAVVEDLDQRAGLTFLAQVPSVVRSTMVTALTEYAEENPFRSESTKSRVPKIRSTITEESVDTRSWATLPKVVTLTRIDLPPGVYDLVLEYRDDWGTVVSRERLDDVEITAGEFSFFNRRVF